MTYEEFLKKVPTYLEGRFPADTQIHIRTILKNNDQKLDGLVIMEPGNFVSPTIYLNAFYERMEEKQTPFSQVMEDVLALYEDNRLTKDLDVDFFSDYHKLKSRIIYKLVSKEKNQKLLQDVPHLEYLDLAVVFLFLFDQKEQESATIMLHNSHLTLWNVTVDDLWKEASVNTPRLLPYVLKPMKDVLAEMMGTASDDVWNPEMEANPLYIVSNGPRVHGASCMLYPNMLSEFGKCMQSDFFIIPSSIHELILFPSKDRSAYATLTDMVQQVNASELQPQDILSDHPYYYCCKTGEITY